MTHLDINTLHRRGALLEGAQTNPGGRRRGLAEAQKNDMLVAGLGVLIWRGRHEIAWEHQPIITRNPPASWGANPWRSRPKFLCPDCGAGAYQLFPWGESFACRRCAGVERPSRADRDPLAGLMRRLAKRRLALGVTDPSVLADPPPPPRAPRSRWLFYRRIIALRLAELAALNMPLEDFLDRAGS
jgi:hypothetical protein